MRRIIRARNTAGITPRPLSATAAAAIICPVCQVRRSRLAMQDQLTPPACHQRFSCVTVQREFNEALADCSEKDGRFPLVLSIR